MARQYLPQAGVSTLRDDVAMREIMSMGPPPQPQGRMHNLALQTKEAELEADIDPQDLQLIAEIQLLLAQRPIPSRPQLECIRSLLLQSRDQSRGGNITVEAPLAPTMAQPPASRSAKVPINPDRAAKIRACQLERERLPWSIGSQLSMPHPPLNGSEKTAATFTEYGSKTAAVRKARGDFFNSPNDLHDFRFDATTKREPTPKLYSSKPRR